MDGQANGSLPKRTSKENGSLGRERRIKETAPSKGFFAWLISSATRHGDLSALPIPSIANYAFRLLLWYIAITALFRCPSSISNLTDTSPKVCKPYLQLRDAVWPHAEPHYKVYLKPYVDRASPYASKFHEQVYTPASSFAIEKYNVYGAPRVAQVWNYSEIKWEEVVQPQIELGRKWATDKYESTLAPHVNQVIIAAGPYYDQLKTGFNDVYESTATAVVPAYEKTLPYLRTAYQQGHHITADIVLPYLYRAEMSTLSFWNKKVWPQLVILYGENVEPQLLRISERLGRYKDGRKLTAVMNDEDTESTEAEASSAISSVSSSASSEASTATIAEPAKPAETELSEAEIREKIESDLEAWQKKFAKASDKGTEDLQERISEITDKQVSFQAQQVGKAHLVKLEDEIESAITSVKKKLVSTTASLGEEASVEDEDAALSTINTAIRAEGSKIRTRALQIRDWKVQYDNETFSLVHSALHTTLDVIDSIRDLGLQEIGMRWAWMEGITYKDWSRYHDLKKTFDEWRDQIETVAREHPGLAKAKEEGETVYDDAMEKASAAAAELVRLQKVAEWKVAARDSTNDFSDRVVPARVARKAQVVMEQVKGAVDDSTDKVSSVIEGASASAEEVFSSLSSIVLGEEPTGTFEKAASSMSSAFSDATEAAESILSEGSSTLSSSASDASSAAESAAGTVLSAAKKKSEEASAAIIGTPPPASESVLSEAKSIAESLSLEASSTYSSLPPAVSNEAEEVLESMSSAASESMEAVSSALPIEEASSVSSSASKKVFGGAMAAHVEAQQIVLDAPFDDDEQSYSDAIASMLSVAGDKATEFTKIISDALVPTSTEQGTIESVTSLASEQYLKAMSAASSVLYGTKPGIFESLSSDMAERYLQAVTAYGSLLDYFIYVADILPYRASYAIHGTPTPVLQSLAAQATSGYSAAISSISDFASSRLSEGLSFASAQYTNAKIAVGATPEPWHQQYLSEAQRKYYEGIGLAHDQYSSYVSAASSVIYGTPTPSYELWASAVSESLFGTTPSVYESLVSVAQAQYAAAVGAASNVLVAATATSTPGYLEQASSAYDAAISSASSYLAAASESASVFVYGTPQPTLQSLLSVAQSHFAGATSKAAAQLALLFSSSTPPAQAFIDEASSQYSAALATASSALNAAWSSASVAVYGPPTPTLQAWADAAGDFNADLYAAASANWASLIAAASRTVYGAPPPLTAAAWSSAASLHAHAWSSASSLHAHATAAAAARYASVSALVSELLVGREPDFAESVRARLADVLGHVRESVGEAAGSVASGVADAASSVSSGVAEAVSSATEAVSSFRDEL